MHRWSVAASVSLVVVGLGLGAAAAIPPERASAVGADNRGTWVDVGPMPTRRASPVAVRLSDGRVLVAGGETSSDGRCKSNADIFDPTSNSWESVAGMHRDRCQAAGVLLDNGTVLVVGGAGLVWRDEPGVHGWFTRYWRSAEIYHPRQDRWTWAAPMSESRGAPILERLSRHRVLVAGGSARSPRTSSEIYRVRRDSWSSVPAMSVSRSSGSSVRLRSGDVLVAGGPRDERGRRAAERYIVSQDRWAAAGFFVGTRNPTLFRTPSGKVQAIPSGWKPKSRPVHIYDPRRNAWHEQSRLPVCRFDPQVVSLRGHAFVLGGYTDHGTYTSRTALLWRPVRDEWVRPTRLPQPVGGHAAVTLRDGSVLVLGGQTKLEEGTHIPRRLAYRYHP